MVRQEIDLERLRNLLWSEIEGGAVNDFTGKIRAGAAVESVSS